MAEEPKRPARRKTRGIRPAADSSVNGNGAAPKQSGADAMKAGYAKSEVKNQAAREALVPLTEDRKSVV